MTRRVSRSGVVTFVTTTQSNCCRTPGRPHLTEGALVVAEGAMSAAGVFVASALGFPPPERRADALRIVGAHRDVFGARATPARRDAWKAAEANARASPRSYVVAVTCSE